MISPIYCRTLAAYNQWINQRLYEVCAQISDQERKADRGAFFKSIHSTLNHLLDSDRIWLDRFLGQPSAGKAIGKELYSSFEALRQHREATDRDIVAWAATLSERWLAEPFEYTSNVDGKARILPTWVLVAHMFNHQTHHRGQLTTLLSQLGCDYGATDLPWLPHPPWADGANFSDGLIARD